MAQKYSEERSQHFQV